jgi:hypothetical protein
MRIWGELQKALDCSDVVTQVSDSCTAVVCAHVHTCDYMQHQYTYAHVCCYAPVC